MVARNAEEPSGIRRTLRETWLALPGRKVPEDIGPGRGVDAGAWDAVRLCLTTVTQPPLAITHLPLDTVPAGFVNLHAGPATAAGNASAGRQITIGADRIGFEPAPIEQIEREAAERVSGGTQRQARR